MKKIVAIDFDGTLADSFGLINKAIIETCSKFNKKISVDELNQYWGPNEEGIFINLLGEKNGREGFETYLEFYEKYHDEYLSESAGIRKVLNELKSRGITVAFLTGRSFESAQISLDHLGLRKYFDKYYYGTTSGVCKVENFGKLCEDYSISPDELLYIGDSVADVKSCKKAGVDLLSVSFNKKTTYARLEAKNPGRVCETVDDLYAKLFNMFEY